MISLKGRTITERIVEVSRELLELKRTDKLNKRIKRSNWHFSLLAMITLHKLNGGSLMIQHTDLGVLVGIEGSELRLVFNKGVKGGPKFTVDECGIDSNVTETKGSTKWLETMIKKQMEFMTKWSI